MPAKKTASKKSAKPLVAELLKQLEFEKKKSARLADALDTEKLNHAATVAEIRDQGDDVTIAHGPVFIPKEKAPANVPTLFRDVQEGEFFNWRGSLHQRIAADRDGDSNALHKQSGCTYALDSSDEVSRLP